MALLAVASLIGGMAPSALAAGGFSSALGEVTPAVAPTFSAIGPQTATVGKHFSVTIKGTGIHELKASGLPAGLGQPTEVPSSGETEWVIEGTPTTPQPATLVELEATNAEGTEKQKESFDLTVHEAPPTINAIGPQTATVGKHFSVTITGARIHELKASGLPAGLGPPTEVPASGETEWVIEGSPTTAQPATPVELEATNAEGTEKEKASFNLTVNEAAAAPVIKTPIPDQTATVGKAFSMVIEGTALHKVVATSGLPAEFALKEEPSSGETKWEISGTPSAAKSTTPVELEAENSEAHKTTASFNLTVEPEPAASSPQPGGPTAANPPSISPSVLFSAARATCKAASWSGGTVTTQWLLDGAPITGATAGTFVPPRSYDGHALSCRQTATANGVSTTLTSASRMVHEQPPQPFWPISPASVHCASAICMQQGAGPGAVGQAYPQEGSWWGSQQVRCVSAPWTSAVGSSAQPAVRAFAEAHTVRIALQRVTSSGVVTVAAQEITALGTARDELDGSSTPFGGSIVAPFGAQPFAAGELWSARFPGSVGRPDWFAAGGGLVAYGVAGTPGVPRSFQLTYTLGAEDLGARLRCVAGADDGPAGAPTSASFVSPEYAVAGSAACGPERLGSASLPQPALVWDGEAPCLGAPSSLAGLGASPRDVAVKGGRVAVALGCGARHGCRGTLALTAVVGHRRETIGKAKAHVAGGALRVVALHLSARGKRAVKAAGGGGLSASLELAARRHASRVASVKLVAQG